MLNAEGSGDVEERGRPSLCRGCVEDVWRHHVCIMEEVGMADLLIRDRPSLCRGLGTPCSSLRTTTMQQIDV
jgi:hypothetical protein